MRLSAGAMRAVCPIMHVPISRTMRVKSSVPRFTSKPGIASSILSKKLAEGIDALVLDVKVGRGAFMKSREEARALARTMVDLCKGVGRGCVALLTPMDAPLGAAVGNAVEVAESFDVLHGRGPRDVRELTLELGVEMLLAGDAPGVDGDRARARARLLAALSDGSAAKRFAELIEAQGGDPRVVDEPSRLPQPTRVREVRAQASGVVSLLDAELVGLCAVELGAGRSRKEDPVDYAAGLLLLKRLGDSVSAGEVVAQLHGATDARLDAGEARLRAALKIGDEAPVPTPVVLERIG
jgi:pyrimidine-nucleoside phosphorylase